MKYIISFVLLLLVHRTETHLHLRSPNVFASECAKRWEQLGHTSDHASLPIYPTDISVLNVTLYVRVERFHSAYVSFNTRTYNGKIPAPTIKVCPGDTLRIHVHNQLQSGHGNLTNLHVHGMHVPPQGFHDNVLVDIAPGESRMYEYSIGFEHPSGHFWYHPHSHGIVNTQLSGMMAGTLIVMDRPVNTPREMTMMDDLVMMLQGICVENCLNKHDSIVSAITSQFSRKKEDKEQPFNVNLKLEGPSPLDDTSLLHVFVNGQYLPKIELQTDTYTRIRYVNAMSNNIAELVARDCDIYLLGMDGIYKSGQPKIRAVLIIPPGGRADIAMRCAKNGLFYIETESHPSRNALLGPIPSHRVPSQRIIALNVTQSTSFDPSHSFLSIKLPKRASYMKNCLKIPSDSIPTENRYTYEFSVWYETATKQFQFGVNHKRMDRQFINHTMPIDAVQEWKLTTRMYCAHSPMCHRANHPFHIHSTHFQIVEKESGFDPENLLYEVGEWRDTIPLYESDVTIRFVPRKHMIGNVMTHCHIAAHVDMGMGQLLRVRE